MNLKSTLKILSIGPLSATIVSCSSGDNHVHDISSTEASMIVTKNTSRVIGETSEEISISTSKMIWTSTSNGTRPNVVILASNGDWQTQLVATDLIHHPSDGPMLITDRDRLSEPILSEIKRLRPRGYGDGIQIITVNMSSTVVNQLKSEGFIVQDLQGDSPERLALVIDGYYSYLTQTVPQSVIISTSENVEYAAPAGNWIAHMEEPLLYTKKDVLPDETVRALKKREGRANIYLLGPVSVISETVENELRKYGKVVRIQGDDPYENAIAFAKYYDPETKFGWNITSPGHSLLLVNKEKLTGSLSAISFSHRGKHAPMVLTNADSAPDILTDYITQLKPLFKDSPTEGPYGHLYLVGDTSWISNAQQGDLDHLIEISSVNGDLHGGSHDHGDSNLDDHGNGGNVTESHSH